MYIRKVEGPRVVHLPDGTTLSRADLPPGDTVRWVASRKALVVKAVKFGLLERDDAIKRYQLTDDEFESWANAVDRHGEVALKATRLQKYRQL